MTKIRQNQTLAKTNNRRTRVVVVDAAMEHRRTIRAVISLTKTPSQTRMNHRRRIRKNRIQTNRIQTMIRSPMTSRKTQKNQKNRKNRKKNRKTTLTPTRRTIRRMKTTRTKMELDPKLLTSQ